MSFDVIVIGGGPAGEHCAARLAAGGLRVAIAERELLQALGAKRLAAVWGGSSKATPTRARSTSPRRRPRGSRR